MNPGRIRLLRGALVALAAIAVVVLSLSLLTRAWGAYRLSAAERHWAAGPGPLDLRGFITPRLDPETNAVTWIRPGVEAVLLFGPDRERVARLASSSADAWGAGDAAALDVILTRNAPAMALLEQARGLERSSWSIPYEQGNAAAIPNLTGAVNAAKVLTVRARLALLRGDRETALASIETLGAMARSYERESLPIVLLVATMMERCQIAVLHDMATRSDLGAKEIERLEASLSDEDLAAAFKRSVRQTAAALAQGAAEDDLADRAHVVLPRSLVRGLAETLAGRSVERLLATARVEPGPVTAPIVQERPESPGWWAELRASYSPHFTGVAPRVVASASARDLARLALALRRAAISGRRYPDALPAVGTVPATDPMTGAGRVYERHPDGSADLSVATSDEILRSIAPVGFMSRDALYRWPLPAPTSSK